MNINSYNCQELGLSKALVNKGWKVSLILAGKANEKRVLDGVDVYFRSFIAINQQLSWFNSIETLLDSLKPTHIQIHEMGLFMSWKVTRWAKKNLIPCFLIQGNYQTTLKPVLKQLEHIYNKTFGTYVLKSVTGIGCKTRMASKYVKSYFNRSTKLTFIGLDDSKFKKPVNKDWINVLDLHGKKILIYVGTMEPRRNPLFLVRVIKELPENYVMIFVGTGPQELEVHELVNNLELRDRCIFLGKLQQEELPSLYSISDAFLLASDYEIYGMVILEALYFGLPVISTLTAGSETLIENERNGYILTDLDVQEWANVIIEQIGDDKKLKQIKSTAQEKVQNEFLWDITVNQFIELYND